MKYNIPLNPEMWYYYKVFQARALQRDNPLKKTLKRFYERAINCTFLIIYTDFCFIIPVIANSSNI